MSVPRRAKKEKGNSGVEMGIDSFVFVRNRGQVDVPIRHRLPPRSSACLERNNRPRKLVMVQNMQGGLPYYCTYHA